MAELKYKEKIINVPDDIYGDIVEYVKDEANKARVAMIKRHEDQLASAFDIAADEKDKFGNMLSKISESYKLTSGEIEKLKKQFEEINGKQKPQDPEEKKLNELNELKTQMLEKEKAYQKMIEDRDKEYKINLVLNQIQAEARSLGLDKTALIDFNDSVSKRFKIELTDDGYKFVHLLGDQKDSYVQNENGNDASHADIAALMKALKPRDFVSPSPGTGTGGGNVNTGTSKDGLEWDPNEQKL